MRARLSFAHKCFVYASLGVLSLGALGWLIGHFLLHDQAAQGLQSLSLKVHGAGAMLTLLALGSLGRHLAEGWRIPKARVLGGLLTALFAALVGSAWFLYYGPAELSEAWLGTAHWVLGLAAMAVFAAHIVLGR
jgi:hypothetical protein